MKRYSSYFILLWGMLVLSLSVGAYNVKSVTNRDGLTNSSVLSICKSKTGLILLGTCDGVCYYDGTRAYPLNSQLKHGTSIVGPIVEGIACGAEDIMWIMTNHGLTGLRRNSKAAFFPEFGGIVRRIKSNADGDLFVITNDTLHCSQGTSLRFVHTPLPDIKVDKMLDYVIDDSYLFIFKDDGIVRFTVGTTADGLSATSPLHLRQLQIDAAYESVEEEYIVDKDGMLWAFDFNNHGLTQIYDLSSEIRKRGRATAIRRIDDTIIVGFDFNGLISLKANAENNGYESTDFGLNVGVMELFVDDENGIIWIGTDGLGAMAYYHTPLTIRAITSTSLRLKQNKPVRSMLIDDEQQLWIGTKGDGLICIPKFSMDVVNYIDANPVVYTTANSQLSGNSIFAMLRSNARSGFYLGTERGLDFYSQKQHAFGHIATPEPIRYACAICEHGDTLWVATQGMGVYRGIVRGEAPQLQLTDVKRFLLDGGQKSSNYFFSMAIGDDGLVYLGNRGKGLFVVDNDKLKYVKPLVGSHSLSLNDVFAILPTNKGVWIGTGDGLSFRGKNGELKYYNAENGLLNSTIHALAEDENGNVWASTNSGLICFRQGENDCHNFKGNNLEVLEYSDGASFAGDGLVAFGGINGVTLIQYDKSVSDKPQRYFFEITGISVLGRSVRLDDYVTVEGTSNTVHLSHEQNTFQLTLSTFDYIRQDNCNFFYSFSGKGHWVDNGESPVINFSHLAPGKYTLNVKYRDILTGQESPVITHYIVITPPWYLSTVAIIAYIILAFLLVWLLYRRWMRRLRRQQQLVLMQHEQEQRDEAFDQKMRFMTNLVHELNTPLTLVYGPCEQILSYEGSDDTVRRYTHMIMQNMARLNFLIKEIIDFRRISVTHEKVEPQPVAVSEWAIEMCNAFSEMAESNHIIYEKDIQPNVVWNVGVRDTVRIFSNLISNAFKYTKQGGNIRVSLWVEPEENVLCFAVYNTGRGIAEKDRERIFNYYTILDNVDESDTVGLPSRNGLGMAICHQAVMRLGGTIDIDSVVGQYAKFIVQLPWQELPEGVDDTAPLMPIVKSEEQPTADVAEIPVSTASGKQVRTTYKRREDAPTVLVIDDNAEILNLLYDIMHDEYNVVTSQSAAKGLEQVKEHMPDLIITDIMMPGIDGLELTQTLKQNKHTRHIPLIILSAKRAEEERIEGLESGADAYLTKPFSPAYLMATVAQLLESRLVLKEYYNSSASTFAYKDGKLLNNEEREFRDSVNEVLEKNLANADFTPEDMARELGVSLRNLYRKFNDAGLPTPKDYIKKYRVTVAARRLVNSSLTIQEIIYATGFNTRTLFYQEFRKYYGMTPKEYREQKFIKDESLT